MFTVIIICKCLKLDVKDILLHNGMTASYILDKIAI